MRQNGIMWEKEEKAIDIEELVSKELACLPPMVKATTQLARNRCARGQEAIKHARCGDVAAWRRDEDVNRGWTYGYPSWSSVEARWLPTSVPMGHCDAAPHDRGAAVRRRVGIRPPVRFEVPRGGAIRG
jgi:hypothetical protein